MKIGSAVAIYFIIWWTVLFAVLPFGVRSSHEEGNVVGAGHDAGAPTKSLMPMKAAITTVIAAVIFAGVYWAINSGVVFG